MRLASLCCALISCLAFAAGAATISGTVTDQSNGNTVSGVTIILSAAQPVVRPIDTVTSNNNGSYTFSDVDQGEYIVLASKTGYVSYLSQLRIQGENQNLSHDIVLVPVGQARTGAIRGTVTSSADNAAVAGAAMILSYRSGTGPGTAEIILDTAYTAANGSYLFVLVPAATNARYIINVIAKGFYPQEKNQISVAENDTTTVNFQLAPLPAPTSKIYGTVKDSATRANISGAQVILRFGASSGSGGASTIIWTNIDTLTTATDGVFRFDSVAPTASQTFYSLVVSALGYRTYTSGNIQVAAGATDTTNVLLRKLTVEIIGSASKTAVQSLSLDARGGGCLIIRNSLKSGELSLYCANGRLILKKPVMPGVHEIALPEANMKSNVMIAVLDIGNTRMIERITVIK